jgi:hypothetical protein
VSQRLAAIRDNEWVAGIAQGLNVVKVSVADVRVEHEVKVGDFTKWLEKAGGSPREVSDSSSDSVDPRHPGLTIGGKIAFNFTASVSPAWTAHGPVPHGAFR